MRESWRRSRPAVRTMANQPVDAPDDVTSAGNQPVSVESREPRAPPGQKSTILARSPPRPSRRRGGARDGRLAPRRTLPP